MKIEIDALLIACTDADGKTYKTVKIGNQVWMAENLAYNTNIEYYAYNDDNSNVAKYGYLYSWETAKKYALLVGICQVMRRGLF